jgi:hypothetical protein
MGILQAAAERGERKTMELLKRAIQEHGHLECAPADIVCHIEPTETHHGLWVGRVGLRAKAASSDIPGWIGLYRCQSHFWGIPIAVDEIANVVARPEALVPHMQSAELQGRRMKPVADLGPMALGVDSLAAALASIEFETLGNEAVEDERPGVNVPEAGQEPQQEAHHEISNAHFEFEDLMWSDNGEIDWEIFVDHSWVPIDEDDEPSGTAWVRANEPPVATIFEVFDQLSTLRDIEIDIVEVRGRVNQFGKPGSPPDYDAVRVTFFNDNDEEYVSPLWADVYLYGESWWITFTTNPDDDQGATYPDDQGTYLSSRATSLEVATVVVEQLLMYARGQQFVDLEAPTVRFLVRVGEYRVFSDFDRGRRIARSCVAWLDSKLTEDNLDDFSLNEHSLLSWVRARDEAYVLQVVN